MIHSANRCDHTLDSLLTLSVNLHDLKVLMLAGFLDSCKHGGPPFKDTPIILIIMAHVKENRLNLWHHIYDPSSDFQRTTPMFIETYKIPTLLCCRRKAKLNLFDIAVPYLGNRLFRREIRSGWKM